MLLHIKVYLHNIGVNHILPGQEPMLYFLQRQDLAEVKPAELCLEESVNLYQIAFSCWSQAQCLCYLEENKLGHSCVYVTVSRCQKLPDVPGKGQNVIAALSL